MIDNERRETLMNQGRMLAIGHYVVGALILPMALLPGFHFAMGIGMMTGTFPPGAPPLPPQEQAMFTTMGAVLTAVAVLFSLTIATVGALTLYAGTRISAMRGRTFLFVVAIVSLLHQPLGLILGIFLLLWLSQDDVRELFAEEADRRDLDAERALA